MSAGLVETCGLRLDGSATCWGYVAPAPPPGAFTQISVGWIHVCGLRPDGSVVCWGDFVMPEM